MTVEFLSETPIPGIDLGMMFDEATNGSYCMNITEDKVDELDSKQTAEALLEHGSEPSFFQLTKEGEDVNE